MELPKINFEKRKVTNLSEVHDLVKYDELCKTICRPQHFFRFYLKTKLNVRVTFDHRYNRSTISIARIEQAIARHWDDFCWKYVFCRECWNKDIWSVTTMKCGIFQNEYQKSIMLICENPQCNKVEKFDCKRDRFQKYIKRYTRTFANYVGYYKSKQEVKLDDDKENVDPQTTSASIPVQQSIEQETATMYGSGNQTAQVQDDKLCQAVYDCLFKDLPSDTTVSNNVVKVENFSESALLTPLDFDNLWS